MTAAAFILSKNRKFVFAAVTPHFRFFHACAAEKHLVNEKTLVQRFFKDTGAAFPSKTVSIFFDTTELL